MEKPYIISAELDLANSTIEPFIRTDKIEPFREDLDASLRRLGKSTLWIGSQDLRNGIQKNLARSPRPIVSLDDRYVATADKFIGISRGVNEQLDDSGYVPRAKYPDISDQLDTVASLGSEITLVDDVLFSGEMVTWLSDELERRNVRIGNLVCGIAIGEGIEKLLARNIDVQAVYAFEDVDDELCERDLAVVPGSGRRIANRDMNALYFDPTYGRPSAWASIPPTAANQFATANYIRSANLLRPAADITDIGNFYGVNQGNAVRALQDRARQVEGA